MPMCIRPSSSINPRLSMKGQLCRGAECLPLTLFRLTLILTNIPVNPYRVGACFGRIVGLGMQRLQWTHPNLSMFSVCKGDAYCVNPGAYAMVGAAATLSGVTVSRSIHDPLLQN
jgi:hypothetical protein